MENERLRHLLYPRVIRRLRVCVPIEKMLFRAERPNFPSILKPVMFIFQRYAVSQIIDDRVPGRIFLGLTEERLSVR